MFPPQSFVIGILSIILVIFVICLKAYAIWMAVKRDQKKWFLALLIINTAGILEIIYIFYIVKKSWSDVKHDFKKAWESLKSK